MPLLNLKSKKEVDKYNQFLEKSNAFFTQTIEWGNVKSNWQQYIVYVTDDNNDIVMSANFLVQKVPVLNKFLLYSPRGPVGDINDRNNVEKLINEVFKIIDRKKIFCIKFDPLVELKEELLVKYNTNNFKIRKNVDYTNLIYAKYNMCVDLKLNSIEDLLLSFNQSTRRKIKQATKDTYEFTCSNEVSDLKRFYSLYVKTNIRKSLSGRSYEYLETMLKSFKQSNIKVCIVSKDGVDLAGSIIVYYNNRVYYAYGATDTEHDSRNASYFMHWSIIKKAFEDGYEIYDMGVCNVNNVKDGVYQFKEGFCREKGYFEAIGEIDYIVDRFVYALFVYLVPLMKKLRHILNKFLGNLKHVGKKSQK